MPQNKIEFVIGAGDKFSGTFKKFGKSLTTVAKTTAKVGAAAAAAGAALTVFVRAQAKVQDQAAKLAQRLGFAVDELTRLQFVADQAGISTQTFNMAIQRMSRRAAEAAQGTGEAVNALRELGVDAQHFNQLGLEGKMAELSDALAGVASPADRVRLAFKLFDSEGVSLLQMLDGGSEKMKALQKDADFLGATMSKQATANATAFTDAMGRLGTATSSASRAVADKLIPIMTGFANAAADAFARNRETLAQWAEQALNAVLLVWVGFKTILNKIAEAMSKVFTREGFDDLMQGAVDAVVFIGKQFAKMGPAIGASFIATFKMIGDTIMAVGSWAVDNFLAMFSGDKVKSIGDLLFETIPKATQESRQVVAAAFGDIGHIARTTGETAGAAITDTLGLSMENLQAQVKGITLKIKEFGTVAQETTKNTGATMLGFVETLSERWTTLMDQQGSTIEFLADQSISLIQNTVNAVSAAVGQAIVFGEDLGKSLKNIAKQVLASIISMLVKIGAQRLVTSLLNITATAAESSAQLGAGVAAAGVNAFASTAAIPIVGPTLAPAAATAAISGATAVGAAGKAAGAALGAAAQGLENVPSTGTFLLHKGERVVKPEQNKDLTQFLRGGGGGGIAIENLEIRVLENATHADALLAMDPTEIRNVIADKFIRAFDELSEMGVKPAFAKVGR